MYVSPEWFSKLRDYQQVGAQWLADRAWPYRGRLLADPPGLGKGRQIVGAARIRHEEGLTATTGAILLITPAIARTDLKREAHIVWPDLPVMLVGVDDGKDSEKRNERLYHELTSQEPRLIVASHESSIRILQVIEKHQLLLGTVAIDEAHRIKKAGTKIAQALRPIVARAERAMLSTGTPIHNRAYDLHNLLDLCAPGHFGSRGRFVRRFFSMRESMYGATVDRLVDKEGLANAVREFVLARSAAEAFPGGLPPKIRKLVEVDVTANVPFGTSTIGIERGLRLLAKKKLPHVVQLALELDEPLVIYAFEKEHASAIAGALIKKGEKVIVATGATAANQRAKYIDQWINGAARILVCTMDAVRESATLTRAAAMIFADLDWLPGKMIQCEGRIDPSRQPEHNRRPARYYYVVCSDGKDRTVAQTVIEKIEEAQGVISKDFNMAGLKDALAPMQRPGAVWDEQSVLADLIDRLEARSERMEDLL